MVKHYEDAVRNDPSLSQEDLIDRSQTAFMNLQNIYQQINFEYAFPK